MRHFGLQMQLLDRYQPLFLIGRGGMGTVEVAVERGQAAGKVFALKRMLPGVRDRRHVVAFLREARLATLLNHDNVVHAFAFGEQDGELFIAMDHVEGETLATLLASLAVRGERLPIQVSTYILAALCDGLHAAHELRDVAGKPLGVVHRDVSPHNVMLSYAGEVKLLDFGVAKLDSAAHLTKTGEVKGKTAYMSPEQAMGDPLDRRSDLYGIGAILFEVLAGRRMWTGETDLELLRQLALGDPPALGDITTDAPPELVALQSRLVAKNPEDRPATAREAAEVLWGFAHEREAPMAALARLLDAHYAEQKRTKRQELEAALARRDEPMPMTTSSPQRGGRAQPWVYALVGAAVASAAVIGVARTRASESRTPETTTTAPTSPSIAPSETSAPSEAKTQAIAKPPPPTNPHTTSRPFPHTQATPHQTPSTTASPPPRPPLDVDPHAI